MKKYILFTKICYFFAICPVLVIAIIYGATAFEFYNVLFGILIVILSFTFSFKKIIKGVALKLLNELGKDDSINFTILAKSTKLFNSLFLKDCDYDDLDKNLKANLRKKNKYQGLVSTRTLYMYTRLHN